SVRTRVTPRRSRAGEGLQPQPEHHRPALQEDPPGHLGPPSRPVREDDRDLDEAQAGPVAQVGDLDLEGVPAGAPRGPIDSQQGPSAEALEPARAVPDRDAQEHTCVQAAESGYQAPHRRTRDGAAPIHAARPDDYVGGFGRRDEAAQVLHTMREVGVHLNDVFVLTGQCIPEAGEVCRREAVFVPPMNNVDAGLSLGEAVGDLAGAVRRVVVNDHHIQVGPQDKDAAHQPCQVLTLVVGGDDHHRAGRTARSLSIALCSLQHAELADDHRHVLRLPSQPDPSATSTGSWYVLLVARLAPPSAGPRQSQAAWGTVHYTAWACPGRSRVGPLARTRARRLY